jgi:hypothetical protein
MLLRTLIDFNGSNSYGGIPHFAVAQFGMTLFLLGRGMKRRLLNSMNFQDRNCCKSAASFSITYIQLSSRNGTIPEALAEGMVK